MAKTNGRRPGQESAEIERGYFLAVGGDQRLRDSAPVRPAGTARQEVLAALDLGTNNCRLLVARPTRGGFHVIDAYSRIVCLGEGLSASGCLSESAMERGLGALSVCAGKMLRRRSVTTRPSWGHDRPPEPSM